MLYDFTFYNPTRIHFGKTAMEHLPEEMENFGENVLLLYGRNSIKENGLYDEVIRILKSCQKRVSELGGIKPNPTYEQVLKGADIVRRDNIDLILAVGGGSVIDCAKAISVSAYTQGDAFQKYWMDFEPLDSKVVPVGSILTMVGTGSEMNGGSVITNEDLMIKEGRVFPPQVNPQFSILNPEFTYSVPKLQMVSGIYDIMSHLCEQYFSGEDDNTTDYLIEAVMKSLIHSAETALKSPTDYEARSNIMWCASMALNRITGLSKTQDWMVHGIEHQLGAYTDCPHGLGLAVISLPYYRHIYKYGLKKFVRFAKNIWDVDIMGKTDEEAALEGISQLEHFIDKLGIPKTLRELGASEDMLEKIAYSVSEEGGYKIVKHEDILSILKECY